MMRPLLIVLLIIDRVLSKNELERKKSIKTLFQMRDDLSWGTGERKDVFLCFGIIYWGYDCTYMSKFDLDQ